MHYVDLGTSTAAASSDSPEEDFDSPTDDPPTKDNEEDKEEPVEQPTAAEIVQAGIAQGQLDKETVPIDQRELDDAEE